MSHEAIFVISTGRCGTQWLARFFQHSLGDAAVVTHEPLHSAWSPREMLAARTPERLPPELREPIDEHLAWIRDALRQKTYIECGHPLWSALPFLIATFESAVRVIHLVRHPVPVAWSWLTQRAFCSPVAPHLREKILVSPFDEGVLFPQYRKRWSAMSPFEKALYYWLEVNAFALRVRAAADVEWLTVKFDDLFDAATQRRLLALAGAPQCPSPAPGVVDNLRFISEIEVDPTEVARHPEVLRLSEELGFDALAFDAGALQARYWPRSAVDHIIL